MPLTAGDPSGTLAAVLQSAFARKRPDRIGVAVSGGGDSVALLWLLSDWAACGGPAVAAVTVDHGLRAEAAGEAAWVGRLARRLGATHDILHWRGAAAALSGGNLPDLARRARYALIGDWALSRGIGVVALAHTLDDQAETVLMRLARGSGVDGLSAMRIWRRDGPVAYVRPLLQVRRDTLRDYLRAKGAGWCEDPTNDDTDYRRIRARRALATLAPLGLTVETLAATADRMALASDALWRVARDLAERAVSGEAGDLLIDEPALLAAGEETRLRLFAAALQWVGGDIYRPRFEALRAALEALSGRPRTLAGCAFWRDSGPGGPRLRVAREAAAAPPPVPLGSVWDGRWRIEGPDAPGAPAGTLTGALGPRGLALCPGATRRTGLPRPTLLASPAVWKGGELIAAPLARRDARWRAVLLKDAGAFVAGLEVS